VSIERVPKPSTFILREINSMNSPDLFMFYWHLDMSFPASLLLLLPSSLIMIIRRQKKETKE